MTSRRKYTKEFKLDAISLVLDQGYTVAEAADKVWYLAFGRPLAPINLGIVTSIGGGLIRDVLAGGVRLF